MKEAGKQESAPIGEREPAIQAPVWYDANLTLTLAISIPFPHSFPCFIIIFFFRLSNTDLHS